MLRAVLFTLIFCGLAVLTSFAGVPPNLERTLKAQQQLVSRNPNDAKAQNDLGNLLMLAGRDAEAEAAYQRAIGIEPGSTAIRFNLALLMQQSGRLEEAETMLDELLEIDPYHGWAHYQLGVLYDDQGDRSKALDHYARAFAYDPSLSFASTNPHIIDNRLSTAALLRAQRYRTSLATRVPRHYSDAQRIADLMLEEGEEPQEERDAGEGEQEAEPGKPEDKRPTPEEKRPASDGVKDGRTGRPLEGDASENESGPVGGEGEKKEAAAGGGSGSPVGAGTVGMVDGRRPATTAPAGRESPSARGRQPGPRSDRQEAMEERFRAFRERMSAGPTPPARGAQPETGDELEAPTRTRVAPRGPRYRPGSASTGRLELRLLPEDPAERYAGRSSGSPSIPSS